MDGYDPSGVDSDVGLASHARVPGIDLVESLLTGLAGLAADAIEGDLSCGITVRHDQVPSTAAASDERAALVDEDQYGAGEGPCLEAIASGHVIHVRDQQTDHRWDAYRLAALDRGVGCSLSIPLNVDGVTKGALNLYHHGGPNAFDASAWQRTELFAQQAATSIAVALRLQEQERLSEDLRAALRSRAAIDQALGILMAEERCDAATAFALLRSHSQGTNKKLRVVATRVVERATGHPPGMPTDFET